MDEDDLAEVAAVAGWLAAAEPVPGAVAAGSNREAVGEEQALVGGLLGSDPAVRALGCLPECAAALACAGIVLPDGVLRLVATALVATALAARRWPSRAAPGPCCDPLLCWSPSAAAGSWPRCVGHLPCADRHRAHALLTGGR
ncbi:hypothetical protein [Streptomyces lunalinharesii]